MFVFGRGEQMRPVNLNLSDYHIMLVYPNLGINTAEAYAGVKPQNPSLDLSMLDSIGTSGERQRLNAHIAPVACTRARRSIFASGVPE